MLPPAGGQPLQGVLRPSGAADAGLGALERRAERAAEVAEVAEVAEKEACG